MVFSFSNAHQDSGQGIAILDHAAFKRYAPSARIDSGAPLSEHVMASARACAKDGQLNPLLEPTIDDVLARGSILFSGFDDLVFAGMGE